MQSNKRMLLCSGKITPQNKTITLYSAFSIVQYMKCINSHLFLFDDNFCHEFSPAGQLPGSPVDSLLQINDFERDKVKR